MKNARLFTLLGGILLIITSAFHSAGYTKAFLPLMEKSAITEPFSGVLKALWWCLSIFFLVLAVIAWVARSMERGGGIVLVTALGCAAVMALMLYFVGPFIGSYLVIGDTVLLAIGGVLQLKAAKPA
jgi:hypothetical protein